MVRPLSLERCSPSASRADAPLAHRHMEAGLAVVFMTDILGAQKTFTLPQQIVDQCEAQGISPTGNAAGKMSLTDFSGAPKGPKDQAHITGWCVVPFATLTRPSGADLAPSPPPSSLLPLLLFPRPRLFARQDAQGQGCARRLRPDCALGHDHGRLGASSLA